MVLPEPDADADYLFARFEWVVPPDSFERHVEPDMPGDEPSAILVGDFKDIYQPRQYANFGIRHVAMGGLPAAKREP